MKLGRAVFLSVCAADRRGFPIRPDDLLPETMDASFLALPVAFVGFVLVLDGVLFGLIRDGSIRSAWFLPSLGELAL